MALTVASSLLEVLSITAILPLFQLLLNPGHNSHIEWIRKVIGVVEPSWFLLAVCGAVCALFAVKTAVSLSATWLKYNIQARLYESLSSHLMNFYLESPISFHLRHGSTELLRNLNSYVSQTTQYGFLGLVDLSSDVLLGLGITVFLVWLEPTISIIAAASLVLIATVYVALAQPYFLQLSRRYKAASAKILQTANEALIGVKTLKTLGRERYFEGVYQRCVADFCDVLRQNAFIKTVPRQVLELIAVVALMGLLVGAVFDGRNPAAFVSILAVFAAAMYRLMPALVRITTTLQNLRFGYEAVEVVYAGITQIRAAKPARLAVRVGSFSGNISLSDLTFSYEGASRPALDRISLEIRNGEAVAFVGSSGAGKTTLADVILGLHKPESGALVINNISYADPSAIPRGVFGYVPQEPFLIDDTIRKNIALGIPDDEIDDEQCNLAIKTAALEEFITGLPDGTNTLIGDRGVRISGGQRQRIGIARAMYADPEVLILDEATSSVDMVTEADITAAINRLHGRKTLIVIAHRLSTIRECDRIFYLDQGRLVASGRYDELIAKNTDFAAMVKQMMKTLGASEPTHGR